jgi:uncharacterized delta-60 repeat protein
MLQQPDGKIIIGGGFSTVRGAIRSGIARLNADGSVDLTFNPGLGLTSISTPFHSTNSSVVSGSAEALALQPDGKVLVAGAFVAVNGVSRTNVARLNTDGTLDTSFDPGGGGYKPINCVALQNDGKVLIGGGFTNVGGTNLNCIARLNADGSLDSVFSPGLASAGSFGTGPSITSLALQADGNILIVGQFSSTNGTSMNIARLLPGGNFDTAFIPGSGIGSPSPLAFIETVALQPDQRILVGGAFTSFNGTNRACIARLNTDGSLDASFDPGSGPKSDIVGNPAVSSLVVDGNGEVLIAGDFTSMSGTSRYGFARLNTDGALDLGFVPATSGNDVVSCIALQTDGNILIGGNFATDRHVALVDTNGNWNDAFNSGASNSVPSDVSSIAIQPDGKVLLGIASFTIGYFQWPFTNTIIRLNPDGSLDSSFNIGSGLDEAVYATALQSDGKILIGGSFTMFNGTNRGSIARLNTDGSLDTTFDPGTGANGSIGAIAVRPDGGILIGGGFTEFNGTNRYLLARLNTDGSLDLSFDPGSWTNDGVACIALQSDGKVLAGGTYSGTTGTRLARFDSDGTPDGSFNPGTGPDSDVYAIAIQRDGKILIGGGFKHVAGQNRLNIARLNQDGTLDGTFNPGSWESIGILQPNDVNAIALEWDGKILAGGGFFITNGITADNLVQFNPDGSFDNGFCLENVTSHVHAMAVQTDGRIMVGGEFGSVNGVIRNRIARIWGDMPHVVLGPTNQNANIVTRFDGLPGLTYTIEASDSLFPGNWQKLNNVTAPTTDAGYGIGVFELQDPIALPARFYRVVYPSY